MPPNSILPRPRLKLLLAEYHGSGNTEERHPECIIAAGPHGLIADHMASVLAVYHGHAYAVVLAPHGSAPHTEMEVLSVHYPDRSIRYAA